MTPLPIVEAFAGVADTRNRHGTSNQLAHVLSAALLSKLCGASCGDGDSLRQTEDWLAAHRERLNAKPALTGAETPKRSGRSFILASVDTQALGRTQECMARLTFALGRAQRLCNWMASWEAQSCMGTANAGRPQRMEPRILSFGAQRPRDPSIQNRTHIRGVPP